MFESLKARLDRLLRDHSRTSSREMAGALREALIEAKAGLSTMRDALAATERELASERRQLEDAERRGRLAAELPDSETVSVAQRFTARHRERVQVLERKLAVQRDELALGEREAAELLREYRAARSGQPSESLDAAWRDLEAAGGDRPGAAAGSSPVDDDDERRRQEAVEAQLAYLKRKLGKREK